MKQRLTNCRLFDGERVRNDCDVIIEGGLVAAIAASSDPQRGDCDVFDLKQQLLAPGLIDLQANGGGGVLFNDAPSVTSLRTIAAAHRRFGTTSFLPTLITDSDAVMDEALAAVAAALHEKVPGVIGIHLEGPYLNPRYKGVHDGAKMRSIDAESLARLTSLSDGIRMITLAPEVVAAESIAQLVAQGIIVCGGHSAATFDETRRALDAGMSGFTHLFNAMTPLKSREPGMVGAALQDRNSFVGIIADGHHIHWATFEIAVAAKASGKSVLVTDAMPTVGSDNTSFDLFGVPIRAEGGRCVTADGVLAGSDTGMITAVKNVCHNTSIDQYEALRMASTYPAAAIGLDGELGYIRPGYRANLIALDDDLNVRASWIDGAMQHYPG